MLNTSSSRVVPDRLDNLGHFWQIESFFRFIKQHLKIKGFIGNSETAVLTQIYAALIVYLYGRQHPGGEKGYHGLVTMGRP